MGFLGLLILCIGFIMIFFNKEIRNEGGCTISFIGFLLMFVGFVIINVMYTKKKDMENISQNIEYRVEERGDTMIVIRSTKK